MKKVKINIEYPPTIQPGEERFFNNGIEIGSFEGVIHLEIRCSDIIITSSDSKVNNKILIKGSKKTQLIPLHYRTCINVPLDSRKEIGVFIHEKKIFWKKLSFLIIGSLIWLSPTSIVLFRPSLISFQIGIGELFIISIPQYVLFALLFSLKRIASIFERMTTYKVTYTILKESHGAFDFITIKKNSKYTKDNMSFTFEI